MSENRTAPPTAAKLFDLSGKNAVITGGSRGLGYEIARAYAFAGARVMIASRKMDVCEKAAAEIFEEAGGECIPVACHVGDWDDCTRLAETAWERMGRVDILINNAGMSPLYDSLSSISEALYDKVLNVNLRGPFRLSALIGERMAEGDGGTIINVSSIASIQPRATTIPYGIAKAGLNTLTVGLAQTLGPKVRVNGIMPGPFFTDISKAWDMEAFAERAKNDIALGRGGEPHEIIGAALYLASDSASYTTGAIIKIDGGAAYSPA
jgi:NAD(P)-dependent dehydrogenase (short-subunit alcohol dehydrogenase family)